MRQREMNCALPLLTAIFLTFKTVKLKIISETTLHTAPS